MILISFARHSYVICMSLVCARILSVCTHMSFVCTRVSFVSLVCNGMPLVCTCMSSVCHSNLLVCHTYAIRLSSVCHSFVLICHQYVTRMHSHVIRLSLIYTRMSSYLSLFSPSEEKYGHFSRSDSGWSSSQLRITSI